MRLPGYRKFREWLKSKQPDEIVGDRGYGRGCPLFNFFVDEGVPVKRVSGFGVSLSPDETLLVTDHPEWRYQFINTIDGNPDATTSGVTAAEALKVLNQVAH